MFGDLPNLKKCMYILFLKKYYTILIYPNHPNKNVKHLYLRIIRI